MRQIVKQIRKKVKYGLARGYRTILGRRTNFRFIGITGSVGKTTTTELLTAILAGYGHVVKSSHNNNTDSIADMLLTVPFFPPATAKGDGQQHRFFVCEVAAGIPGIMAKSARLLRPNIGIVTNIGQDHYTNYRGNLEATANDKAQLIEALGPDGTAVLNADDANVLAMRNRTNARIITYGLSKDAMVHGENVSCAWPEAMSLDICFEGRRAHVQTQLLGEHWAYAVLAAICGSIAAGVPLEQAAETVETFKPVSYRMCPHKTPDGVTFISDT